MPRLKNKPIELDESRFIDWLLEVYYYKMLDQGMLVDKTLLMLSARSPQATALFLEQVRSQLVKFNLSFPLSKIPELYQQALRESSTRPQQIKVDTSHLAFFDKLPTASTDTKKPQ
jgi:hypothetical protein